MLTHLHIRDFAIIDELELDLNGGMTALTGETGAGMSLLVEALGLALGDRADSGVERHGRERADVSASFDIAALPELNAWLGEQGLEAEGECIARRLIPAEGRSRGFINGHAVPIQTLQQLGSYLVDIHGQHEHQSLLRREVQRQLLDDYADHGNLLQELAAVRGRRTPRCATRSLALSGAGARRARGVGGRDRGTRSRARPPPSCAAPARDRAARPATAI